MKIFLTLKLAFAFFILPGAVFGQKGFQTGYIITNENDTLEGKVKDRKPPPFGKLHKKVRFKSDKKQRKYAPDQILGYKQGNTIFESLWIDITGSFFREEYLSVRNRGEKKFMKVVIKGYLTYYQLEIEDPETDYIDGVDLFKRANENSLVRVTQGILGLKRKQLAAYFSDYPELANKIVTKDLKDPVHIAKLYNDWKQYNP